MSCSRDVLGPLVRHAKQGKLLVGASVPLTSGRRRPSPE